MTITFYPPEEDIKKNISASLETKIDVLLEAAKRYRAAVNEPVRTHPQSAVPADLRVSYNWDCLAAILREVRELSEANPNDKQLKEGYLLRLAQVYEVLRASKMQKLEAVRLALVAEANQLRGPT